MFCFWLECQSDLCFSFALIFKPAKYIHFDSNVSRIYVFFYAQMLTRLVSIVCSSINRNKTNIWIRRKSKLRLFYSRESKNRLSFRRPSFTNLLNLRYRIMKDRNYLQKRKHLKLIEHQQKLKYISHVILRENIPIIKMLSFHTTSTKRLRRTPPH